MARPREFDREEALASAITVFAEHGYEGSSTEILLKAMGLNRQSLYDTYGSKRQLYLEALRRYNHQNVADIVRDIAAGATPLAGLEQAFAAFVERAVAPPYPSCLGVGAICEFGLRDAEVLAAGEASHALLLSAVTAAIEQAKAAGQLDAKLETETAVDFLLATLAGLKLSARGGVPRDRLQRMARLALQALSGTPIVKSHKKGRGVSAP